jgi:G3E family GTPase
MVLADLIGNGLDTAARPLLLTSDAESEAPADVGLRLAAIASLQRGGWSIADARFSAGIPPDVTHVFILADGRGNPVDQVEAFHQWLPGAGVELARVITVVDCILGAKHPELLRWYDACVHFSDVVLLNRREGVPNKWVSDFIARYRKQHYPCLIELVKRGELANPALVLEPQARRVSQVFDETDAITVTLVSDEEDDEADESGDDDGEVVDEYAAPVDPYFERLAGSRRRAKEIPDIAKFLSGSSP